MQAIFGRVIKTPYNQRVAIKALVEQNNKDDILRFNAGLVNAKSENDFYYDPHTKHYTGQLKTLATWCPSVRLADKGINGTLVWGCTPQTFIPRRFIVG